MGDYDFTETKDGLEAAGTQVRKMIEPLEKAIQAGGFDDQTVQNLVLNWTEAGKIARGDGYWSSTHVVWRVHHFVDRNFSKKTSLELLDRLKRLEQSLIRQADIKVRFDAFNEAEEAMLKLVSDYRVALRGRNLAALRRFDGQLTLAVDSLDPKLPFQLED